MLSSRLDAVLKSIVSQYIDTAVPVPSQSLVREGALRVCSATIRNDMMHLEREGYIIRPFTSSGGVPTDKGYRYYVESLPDTRLPLDEQRMINHLFHQVERRLDEWLNLAVNVAARMTQNVAVITEPRPADCQFRHLELVALRDALALVVLVLDGAKIKRQLVSFGQVLLQPELTAMSNRLNAIYSGLSSSQILAKKIVLSPVEKQVTDCVVEMMRSEGEREFEEPYLDGLHFILHQPEFTQSQRAATLMELVEQRSLLKTIIPQRFSPGKVQITIGEENQSEVVRNYSVVASHYGVPDEALGTVAILGPTRMPYAVAIAVVSYLSLVLSHLLGDIYRRGGMTPDTGDAN